MDNRALDMDNRTFGPYSAAMHALGGGSVAKPQWQ
jgi:hypothetical protein